MESLFTALPLKESIHFAASRRHMRDALFAAAKTGKDLNELVFELIA